MEHHWYDRPGLHRERSVSLAHAAVRRRGADPSLFTRLGAFTASLLCVSCLCLAAASGAQADFVAVGTGACADASPPAGETGGYYWVGSDGTCSPDWISSSDLQSLANQEVAAGDEATGATVPSDIPTPDESTGTSLWDSLVNATSSLKGSAMDFLSGIGDWPVWSTIGTAAPLAVATAGTIYIGWKVGSAIADFLGIDSGPSDPSYFTANSLIAVNDGTRLDTINYDSDYCGGYSGQGCTASGALAPSDGFLVIGSGNYTGFWQMGDCPDPLSGAPSDSQQLITESWTAGYDFCSGQPSSGDTRVYFVPQTVTSLPGPGQGGTTEPTTIDGSGYYNQASESQQKANATSMLENSASDPFTQTLCQAAGSPCPNVPPPYTDTIPSPSSGESLSDFQSDLSGAGITNVTYTTLTADTADLDEPAGAIVGVSPAPGTSVFPVTTNVVVTSNPATMPEPSERETDLADALESETGGIETANDLDVARQCLADEDVALDNTDTTGDAGDESYQNCSTLPIFITGHDAQAAGQHDQIALGQSPTTNPALTFSSAYGGVDPTWVLLHRVTPPNSRSWLDSAQPCDSDIRSSEIQCDEYPFASVQEGGQDNNPNLQLIDGGQNSLQGGKLSGFYSSCSIPDGGAFLAIAVPDYDGVNTTWTCGS
jgi:hypothetical protein